VVERLGDAT